MEKPKKLTVKNMHNEKVKILRNLELLPFNNHLLGQYKSYAGEAEKAGLNSRKVETFCKLVLNCRTKRWDGTKLILRTGKKLKRKYGQIIINYKDIGKGVPSNKIIIDIFPKQDVVMKMNSINPFENGNIKDVKFEFCRDYEFGPNGTDEYSTLLSEAIKGEKMMFARSDEVRESWKIVEKIEEIRDKIKFVIYPDGGEPESD